MGMEKMQSRRLQHILNWKISCIYRLWRLGRQQLLLQGRMQERKSIRGSAKGFLWQHLYRGGIVAGIACVLMLGRESLFLLFVKDWEVASYGIQIIMITFPFYWLYPIMEVFGGAIRGMGYSVTPMFVILSTLCGARIGLLAFFNDRVQEVKAVAAVYPITWFLAVLAYFFIFYKIVFTFERRCICEHTGENRGLVE